MANSKITDLADAGGATALDYLYIVDGATSKHVQFDDFEASLTHDNLIAGTIADHDTSATGTELDTLTDGSDADALHAHATNDAKNTNVSTNLSMGTVDGTQYNINSSDGTNVSLTLADTDNWGIISDEMFDQLAVAVAHYGDNTQAHSDYLLNSAADVGVGLTLTGDNSSADTAYVPMILYNTDATPPVASGYPIGTLYFQYTA